MFAAALAVFLSAVNVYLRDTQHLVEVLLVAWFWAIPASTPSRDGSTTASASTPSSFIPGTHLIWLYFANPVDARWS